jgi:formamidopyrimidine-DNA glycosylase
VPELPDILLYLHALRPRVVGHRIERVRLVSPFLLRSVDPPLDAVEQRRVVDLHRLGKRIVFEAEGELFLVFHLMIAGRFRWTGLPSPETDPRKLRQGGSPGVGSREQKPGVRPLRKPSLLAIDFDNGTLVLTEAGTKRRASLYLVAGRDALLQHDPGGQEIADLDLAGFEAVLRRANHTLKRALTDPHLFSGIGNAYSDEILHAARLSPFKQTQSLTAGDVRTLFEATRGTLSQWTARLQREAGDAFPEKVTAFRDGMSVHGRYGQPCPDCGSPVQRVVYAANEANYCATCQTAGRLLADRSLSRLLRDDWPRTLEELERRKRS